MRIPHIIVLLALCSLAPLSAQAQKPEHILSKIGESLQSGDHRALADWFSENLAIDVLGRSDVCSSHQARLILKDFFANNRPKSFQLIHMSGQPPMIYGICILHAGGATYRVTLCVSMERNRQEIQQIRIEKDN